MFKQVLTTAAIGLGLAMANPALAHTYHHHHNHDFQHISPVQPQVCKSGKRIDQRQANQKRRIKKGVRNGQLVRWEAKQLRQQQKRIRRAEQRMRNSGHCLTPHEVQKLMKKLNRASQRIKQLKHNNVRRGHGHGHRHHRNHR